MQVPGSPCRAQRPISCLSILEKSLVSAMMTSEGLAMLQEPADLDEARSLMQARRIEKLLVTNDAGELTGLLTLKDSEQAVLNPSACKDQLGRLRVAAASTVGDALEREANKEDKKIFLTPCFSFILISLRLCADPMISNFFL